MSNKYAYATRHAKDLKLAAELRKSLLLMRTSGVACSNSYGALGFCAGRHTRIRRDRSQLAQLLSSGGLPPPSWQRSAAARVVPQSGFSNLKIQARLNLENLLRAPCTIAVFCVLNRDIACSYLAAGKLGS